VTRRRRARAPVSSRLLAASACLVLAFLVVPVLLVAPMSFSGSDFLEFPPSSLSLRWYAAYFTDPDWIEPTLLSLKVALLTAVAATVLGAAASLAIVRSRLAGSNLFNAAVAAPMVAPAIIVAVALYLVLSRLHLTGATAGFVLADTMLALPLVIFTVSAALRRVDPRLEQAAISLGASRFGAMMRILLPLARPGILVGAAFAFITSFDEVTVAFFISTAEVKTLPKKMFEGIEWELSPVIAAVSTLLTVVSLALVLLLALASRSIDRRSP
jgi:mannopine transport system permease protein